MKDRVVQFPGRYRDKNTGMILDLEPVPGTVTEAGTPINKAALLSDETAALLELEQENPTVNDALIVLGSRDTVYGGAYGSDLYLYIIGRHPLLNSNPIAYDYPELNWGVR